MEEAASSTSTSISLHPLTQPAPTAAENRSTSTAAADDAANILQASHLADAEAPDGGYGWVVVFSCAVLTWWFVGTSYSWVVLQAALVQSGLSSPSTLSFVGSLTAACISFLAVLNARIIRKLGARSTALVGIVLLGGGEVLSGFSTENIEALFVTTGIVTGVGMSLCFMVVSVTPAQYFKLRRGLANGIVYASGGFGGTAISFIMDGLIKKLGTAWAFRVIGLITLATGLPAAWLIKERAPIRTSMFIEWRLFRDVRFAVLFVAGAVATFPLFVPPFFLPLYTTSLGLSSSAGASFVAAFNFSSAIGRLLCGFASDKIGPLNSMCASLLLSGLSMLLIWPFSDSAAPLIVFVILNGAANGGFFATMPTAVGNVFGSARVSVAMGMIVTGWAGGYLMGAPIAGYILNASGGGHRTIRAYHPAIFYAGSMELASGILVAFVRLNMDRRLIKKL